MQLVQRDGKLETYFTQDGNDVPLVLSVPVIAPPVPTPFGPIAIAPGNFEELRPENRSLSFGPHRQDRL